MTNQQSGDRHSLLFYHQVLGRVRRICFIVGLILIVFWIWTLIGTEVIYIISAKSLLLLGAIFAFGLGFLMTMARLLAYVQARDKYLLIRTPFLPIKIPYQRMHSTRPMLIQQIFPPEETKRALRNFLEPYHGKTALVLELISYPNNLRIIKLLVPPAMFSPQFTGFVLLVPDWMKLSTELDSHRGSWQQEKKSQERASSLRSW